MLKDLKTIISNIKQLGGIKADLSHLGSTLNMIEIDPTTVCNLRCVMCHNATGLAPANFVDMAVIESVRDFSLKSDLNIRVNLTGIGEFLCHPQWRKILTILSEGKCDIIFFSNGLLLKEEDIDFIWNDTRVYQLNVSMDAVSEKTYKRIRRGGDFSKLKQIVKKISNHNNKRIFALTMCVISSNAHEMQGFCKYAADIGATGVIFQTIHDKEYPSISTKDGYVFDGKGERISGTELREVLRGCSEILDTYNLSLSITWPNVPQWLNERDEPTIIRCLKRTKDIEVKYSPDYYTSKGKIVNMFKQYNLNPKCFYPWTRLSLCNYTREPSWRVCCLSSIDSFLGGKNAALEAAWNSFKIKKIRQLMLKGKRPKQCLRDLCGIARELDG